MLTLAALARGKPHSPARTLAPWARGPCPHRGPVGPAQSASDSGTT